MTWAQASKRHYEFLKDPSPNNVGPGSYDTNSSSIKKVVPYRPSKDFVPRDCLPRPDLITPGPGSYSTDVSKKKENNSSFFVSRVPRGVYQNDTAPSAADYSIIEEWRKENNKHGRHSVIPKKKPKPKVLSRQNCNYLDDKGRLVHKDEDKRDPSYLGPGSYDVKADRSSTSYSLNRKAHTADLFGTSKNTVPAPGHYDYSQTDSKMKVSIKGSRDQSTPTQDTAVFHSENHGKIVTTKPTPQFLSRSNRQMYDVRSESPGPGEHHTENQIKERKQAFSAFGSRDPRFRGKFNNNPSPSDYVSHHDLIQKTDIPSVMQSRSTAIPPKHTTPENLGPGAYDPSIEKKYRNQSPMFISRSERMPDDDNGVPSPADYVVQTYNQPKASILATRYNRIGDWALSNTPIGPSPETYQVQKESVNRGYTIPKATRFNDNIKVENIGPGSYSRPPSLLKRSFNSAVPRFD